MKVTDESLLRLRALPAFFASQVRAVEGVEATRRVLVLRADGTETWYENDDTPIDFRDGDQIELVPAAEWSLPYSPPEGDE